MAIKTASKAHILKDFPVIIAQAMVRNYKLNSDDFKLYYNS